MDFERVKHLEQEVERLRKDYDAACEEAAKSYSDKCSAEARNAELQQEVETLRHGIKEIAELNQDIRDNWERYDAETSARIAELEVDLEIETDKQEKMAEALEPFVRHLHEMKFDLDHEGNELPGEQTCGCVYLTLADFRRARAVLEQGKVDAG